MIKNNNLTHHYQQLLGLSDPWDIKSINLDVEHLNLVVDIFSHKGNKLPCPVCSKLSPREDTTQERSWRHLDTMQFQTIIRCKVPRVRCSKHGVKTIKVPWASKYSRFTILFEKFAIDIIQVAKSITSAKKILRLSWKQIYRVQRMAVERGLERREANNIDYLGMDEKSFLKGHSYISVLNDLNKGRVIDIVKGRTKENTKELLDTLTDDQKDNVKAVAVDMWKAFITIVNETMPDAEIVHDKFHISGYLNKAVDVVRKKENKSLKKDNNKLLVGSKYLWLTNEENLTDEAQIRFEEIKKTELEVSKAWLVKEMFRHFWDHKDTRTATQFFDEWYAWTVNFKIKAVTEVAEMLKRHFKGLIAYLKYHITNAVSEGLNSRIQSIKSNARGFRNFNNYRISILFHCGKLELYP